MLKRLMFLGSLFLAYSAHASDEKIIAHCFIDDKLALESCYYELTDHQSSYIYVDQTVADRFAFKPDLARTLDWSIEDDRFISDLRLEVTETWTYCYDHNALIESTFKDVDFSVPMKTLSADCNDAKCKSAVIGAGMEGAVTGAAAGAAVGLAVGGAQGAAGGAVIGASVNGVAAGLKEYGNNEHCGCGGGRDISPGRSRGSVRGGGFKEVIYMPNHNE